ncbi:MAG: cytochrome P460 family protein [Gemmataceae bacterium]
MRGVLALVVGAGVALAWAAPARTHATQDNPEKGRKTEWDGYHTWYRLTKGRAITGDPTGFLGNKDVEKGYREVYVNAAGAAVSKGPSPYVYPEGTVIVREVYADKKAWEEKKTPALTISIKLKAGAAPESKDWEYVLIPPGEKEQRGRGNSETGQFCTKCHLNAKASNDYHFTNAAFFEGLKSKN